MHKGFAATSALLLAIAFGAACTVHNTQAPSLSGPSEFGLSLAMTATPDSISQDGASQSSVQVTARDANSKAIQGQVLRVDMAVGGVIQDFGTLSARTIVTDSKGQASTVYTAPPPPPPSAGGTISRVSIVVTPIGTDAQATNPQSGPASIPTTVDIRLVPVGVILPPASTPTPKFITSPTSLAANIPIQFDASSSCAGASPCSSSAGITNFAWNFGDGTAQATGQIVTHTFSAQGTFNVTLTVANDRGLSASTTQALSVAVGAPPTPSFTVSPSAAAVQETVYFNASTSTPGSGHSAITSYRWTFGDGGTASGMTATHSYAVAGTYTVQLTVTDESGQSNTSAGTTITVGSPPTPTANFTFSPGTPAVNQAVTFDASTSTPAVGPGGQPIVSYAWSFGDNTAAQSTSSPTFSHTFGFAGTFSVNLVVRDSAGRTSPAKSNSIIVASAVACADVSLPCATITFTPSPAPVNTEISFVASVTSVGSGASTIVNYQWNFGDGTQTFGSSVPTVGYTYRTRGTYTVKLTVTNNAGKAASATITVLVQ